MDSGLIPLGPMDFLDGLLRGTNDGKIELPVGAEDKILAELHRIQAMGKSDKEIEQIVCDAYKDCEFVAVDSLQFSQMNVWFRKKNAQYSTFKPFRETQALSFIYALLKRRKMGATKEKAKRIYDTLKIATMKHEDSVPQDIIRVSDKYYWDTEEASLREYTDKPCFRELFDSSGQASVRVNIEDVKFEEYEVNILTRYLEEHDGVFPTSMPTAQDLAPQREDFKDEDDYEILAPLASATLAPKVTRALAPFATWATIEDKLSLDTMNDLLKVFCTPFLNTTPKWYVYYIGDTRNGKSSCIKCQRVLMGLNNTSGFAMPALFDPHNTNHILTTMLNAADEDYDFDDKNMQQGLANFKKAVTHDELDLPNFYSQDSTTLTPKFMSIFSRNSLPNFGEGDGAQAISKRMRAIFFRNDLSKFDNNGHDFEKETYTAKFYSELLPVILAYARYYSGKLMDLSETCRANSGAVESMTDPATYFFHELCYWFDYTGKTDFIIDQAKMFFKENGIKYSGDTLTAISNKLGQCEKSKLRNYLGIQKNREIVTSLPNKAKRVRIKVLSPDAILSAYGGKTFEQWRREMNNKAQSMDAQQFADMEIPSIFAILRELEDDGLNPVAMQEALIEKENKIAEATIDDRGNLVAPNGDILNGLL